MTRTRGGILQDRPDQPDRSASRRESGAALHRQRVLEIDRRLARGMLARMGRPPIELVLWDDEPICLSLQTPRWTVRVADRQSLLRLVWQPDPGFGEGYAAGRITVEGDLVTLLETAYRALQKKRPGLWRSHRNTLAGSRRNIHHHYDIGNAFYQLWLDERMLYTCAYFPQPTMTLEAAQLAKMDHICRKLQLKPGDRVVEAGCGWGALAMHMASKYGVTVRAFNISREQIAYARHRAEQENLADRVEFIEDDYRNISGTYDAFVSVGMLEHVGTDHYRELGEVIARSLTNTGRGLIHTIGRHRPQRFSRWIEMNIFPGADPPTLRQMMDLFESYDMCVLDVENLRLHYARTLQHWLTRFENARDQVARMFDEAFVRAWRLYLAGSAAAFTTGQMHLYQVVFARADDNTVPWSRAAMYQD